MSKIVRWIAGAVVVLLLAGGAACYFLGDAGDDGPKLATLLPLHLVKGNKCQTQAPDGWEIADANANGTVFNMESRDHSMIAGYTAILVKGAIAQGSAGQPGTPPRIFIRQLVSVLTGAPLKIIADGRAIGPYEVMAIESGGYGGYALYNVFTVKEDPAGYGVLLRVALGNKDNRKSLAIAGSVAAATRCVGLSVPLPNDSTTDSSDSHGTGTTALCHKGSCDDSDLAGTFNAQLGTGWVHDTAGRNYDIDVDGDYNDHGPDGPGYYATIDGARQLLQPGLQ